MTNRSRYSKARRRKRRSLRVPVIVAAAAVLLITIGIIVGIRVKDEREYQASLAEIRKNADSVTAFNDQVDILGMWFSDNGGYYDFKSNGVVDQFIPAGAIYEGSEQIIISEEWSFIGNVLKISDVEAEYSIDGDVLRWGAMTVRK